MLSLVPANAVKTLLPQGMLLLLLLLPVEFIALTALFLGRSDIQA